jgi:hypothetical protein
MSKSLLLLACTPMLLGGCLAGAISSERFGRVERLSRFQSKCSSLKLVSRSTTRFHFSGCGKSYVYRCHDRRNPYRKVNKVEAVAFLFTAGMDTNAPCNLADVYWDGSRGPRRVARRAPRDAEGTGSNQPPSASPAPPDNWTAPEGVDDPGPVAVGPVVVAPLNNKKKLPRLPDAAELKRAMSVVQPGVRRCAGAAGRVAVDLRLRPSGAVESARVKAALPQPAKRCVEGELRKATVAPFAGSQPLTLAYLFDLR